MKKVLMMALLLGISGWAVAAEDFKREIGAPKSGSFSHEQMKKAGELFDKAERAGDTATMDALINYFKPAKNPAAQKIAARWQDRLNAMGAGAEAPTEAEAPEEEAEAAPEEEAEAPAPAPAPAPKPAAAPAAPAKGAGAGVPPVAALPALEGMNYSQLAFLYARKQNAMKDAVGPNKAALAKQVEQIRAEMAKKE